MLRYSFVLLVPVFVLIFSGGECRRNGDLDAILEFLSPRGLKISLINIDNVVKVDFRITINGELYRVEFGQWVLDKKNRRWTYIIPGVKKGSTTEWIMDWCTDGGECRRNDDFDATLEFLSPRGLKISLINTDNVVEVDFRITINGKLYRVEFGRAHDKRDRRWTYIIPGVKEGNNIEWEMDWTTESDLQSNSTDQPTPRPTPEVIITDNTPEQDGCTFMSPTIRNGGVKTCRGEVLFNKRFNNLDGFSHQIHIGGSEPDDEFTVFTKDNAVSYTDNGHLIIRPKLLEDAYSEEFVRTGTLNLDGCTSTVPDQCSKTGATYLILPPVMGARLTSKGSFSFRYGILEIRAKLPRGDWIVPELWLEPLSGAGTRAGRVVLAMSRGNVNNNRELEAGVIVATGPQMGRKVHNASWSQDFHTFKLVWTRDNMQFYVDGDLITRFPQGAGAIEPSLENGQVAPFDKEYYITLGLHVAGQMDFPDDMPNKPWKNSNPKRFVTFWEAKDSWKASWDQDAALKVEYIKVTAL